MVCGMAGGETPPLRCMTEIITHTNSPTIGIWRGDKMLFYVFNSQEERRNFGGSAFIEIQFCELPVGTREKKLLAVSSIKHWKNNSLYIYLEDIDSFYQEYNPIFDCDIYGINYYAPSIINQFIEKLNTDKPSDYERLIGWLNKAKHHNGFYILGI